MKIRICPYCDGEMTKAHKCDGCGSWVWKPEVLDIHFNADTRGLGEADCAYGDEHDAKDHKERDIWKAYRQPIQQLTREHKEKEEKTERRSRRAERRSGKAKPGLLILVVVIWMIINIVIALVESMDSLDFDEIRGALDNPVMIKEEIQNLFGDGDEAHDGIVFLDSDEIYDYTDRCNASGHFAMNVGAVSEVMDAWLEDCYKKEGLKGFDAYDDNWIDYNSYVDGEPMVRLNSTWVYSMDDDDEELVYVDFDSVTTHVHSVSMYDLPVRNVKPLLAALMNAEISSGAEIDLLPGEPEEIVDELLDEGNFDYSEGPLFIYGRVEGNTVVWCDFGVNED